MNFLFCLISCSILLRYFGLRDGEEMALAWKCSRDEGSGSHTPSRVHLCSISPGERDDCGSRSDPERRGLRDAASLDLFVNTSAHPSRLHH